MQLSLRDVMVLYEIQNSRLASTAALWTYRNDPVVLQYCENLEEWIFGKWVNM